jgi:hypothetical protein
MKQSEKGECIHQAQDTDRGRASAFISLRIRIGAERVHSSSSGYGSGPSECEYGNKYWVLYRLRIYQLAGRLLASQEWHSSVELLHHLCISLTKIHRKNEIHLRWSISEVEFCYSYGHEAVCSDALSHNLMFRNISVINIGLRYMVH